MIDEREIHDVQRRFGIIGSSEAIHDAVRLIMQVAPTDLATLIVGESGTGKEVFARAIHSLSLRSARRLVAINCGAIPETLLESELFGHEKGAFTGATETRKGFFEAADGGTIFLDEIGEMPVGTQVKLLRVLETGEFMRLGSTEPLRTNARIVAATNRTLEEEIERGNFRRDLYFRLNAIQIRLQPLREHIEDIPELATFFARRTAAKLGIRFAGFTEESVQLLSALPWTGNVRELRNVVETIVTLGKGKLVTAQDVKPFIPKTLPPATETKHSVHAEEVAYIPSVVHVQSEPQQRTQEHVEREVMFKVLLEIREDVAAIKSRLGIGSRGIAQLETHSRVVATDIPIVPSASASSDFGTHNIVHDKIHGEVHAESLIHEHEPATTNTPHNLNLEEMERYFIVTALERTQHNRRKAAKLLGISERTLYRKIHQFGLDTEGEYSSGTSSIDADSVHDDDNES